MEQEKWEEQQREQMYEDERALQETLEDAAREDCYADYSGGKGPHMECDYHTGSSSSKSSSQESAIIGGVVVCIIIAIIVAIVLGKKKPSRY